MQSISRIRSLAALAMGALVGGHEAMAWCPTASDKTISCNNCTVTLSCDVERLGAIVIAGYNVTFDGAFHEIKYSTQSAIYVTSDLATITRVIVTSPAVACITASTDIGDRLILNNNILEGGTAGVAHYYNGHVQMYNSGLGFSDVGYYSGYGNPSTGGYADAYSSTISYTIGNGVHVSGKPVSYINNVESRGNAGHGVVMENSPRSMIWGNRLYNNNLRAGKNGLRVISNNQTLIQGNTGYGNTSYDCYVASSTSINASGNSWSTSSGPCN